MRYLHFHREDCPGKVSTVEICSNGYAMFGNEDGEFSNEYSVRELKEVIAEIELAQRQGWWESDTWDEEDWKDLEQDIDLNW